MTSTDFHAVNIPTVADFTTHCPAAVSQNPRLEFRPREPVGGSVALAAQGTCVVAPGAQVHRGSGSGEGHWECPGQGTISAGMSERVSV